MAAQIKLRTYILDLTKTFLPGTMTQFILQSHFKFNFSLVTIKFHCLPCINNFN